MKPADASLFLGGMLLGAALGALGAYGLWGGYALFMPGVWVTVAACAGLTPFVLAWFVQEYEKLE